MINVCFLACRKAYRASSMRPRLAVDILYFLYVLLNTYISSYFWASIAPVALLSSHAYRESVAEASALSHPSILWIGSFTMFTYGGELHVSI